MDLTSVLDTLVTPTTKGVPGALEPFRLRDVQRLGLSMLAEDLPLPLLVLKRSALTHNLALMESYCRRKGVLLAPHGKTTMAPQLFAEQFAHGAWGLTAASVQQVQVYRHFGVQRVVLANEVVGRPNLDYLGRELATDPDFDLYCWVDSPAGVDVLADTVSRHGLRRPIQVLLELGWPGGRTGARSDGDVTSIIDRIVGTAGGVRLEGLAVFEGLLNVPAAARAAAGGAASGDVADFLAGVVKTARRLADAEILPSDFLLSGGGSTSFDEVVRAFGDLAPPARVLLRSGCYITHDHGMYAQLSPLSSTATDNVVGERGALRPALELWAYVNSAPEPGLAFLTFGRRDAPYDAGLPVPLARVAAGSRTVEPFEGGEVVGLNDQHCYLRHTSGDLAVGDRVVLGISHPCAAFDKWQLIPVVDDEYNVIEAIRTFF